MYRKESKGWFKHYDFILLGLLSLQVAFIVSYMLRHGFSNPYAVPVYRNMAIFIVLADIVVLFFFEPFKNVLKRNRYQEFLETVKHAILVVLLAVLYLFAMKEGGDYSRLTLFMMGGLYLVITYISRISWKGLLSNKMKNGNGRSLLIVTTEELASGIIHDIKNHNYEMFSIAGIVIVDREMTGEAIEGVPVVAGMDTAANYVCRQWVDDVFVNFASYHSYPQDLVEKLMKTGVVVHLNLAKDIEKSDRKQFVEKVSNYTVLTTSMNYMTAGQAFLKRALDIAGGLVGCILTGIIFLFIAPVIYIKSPGPIFFSQIRIGKNGKKFKLYKFRSMYMDAEERKKELMKENRFKDGMMFKIQFDTRVIGNRILPNGKQKTGIGNFIRVTSLDEFPQFFNVLKGDMSLVGTRPPTVDEWEKYELHHRARLAIKPGITGMWQVSGRSDVIDFEEVVKLDTRYINEWSAGLDFRILFKTVTTVLARDGSM